MALPRGSLGASLAELCLAAGGPSGGRVLPVYRPRSERRQRCQRHPGRLRTCGGPRRRRLCEMALLLASGSMLSRPARAHAPAQAHSVPLALKPTASRRLRVARGARLGVCLPALRSRAAPLVGRAICASCAAPERECSVHAPPRTRAMACALQPCRCCCCTLTRHACCCAFCSGGCRVHAEQRRVEAAVSERAKRRAPQPAPRAGARCATLRADPAAFCSPLVDWESLGFGLTPTAAMYVATCARGDAVRRPAVAALSVAVR